MSKKPVQDFGSKMADQKLPACDSMHERVIKNNNVYSEKRGKDHGESRKLIEHMKSSERAQKR